MVQILGGSSHILGAMCLNKSPDINLLRSYCEAQFLALKEKKNLQIRLISKVPPTRLPGVLCLATFSSGRFGRGSWKGELELDSVRKSLIGQEDTFIYNILQRAQYPINKPAFDATRFSIPGFEGSLVEYMLKETEQIHAKLGRYSRVEEHPFFPDGLPASLLPSPRPWIRLQEVLEPGAANPININSLVWSTYFNKILPRLVADGDDGNYGSSATCDILCLQSLSHRIHYGKFVAEAKFRDSPFVYGALISAGDAAGLMNLITVESVERTVQERVENKVCQYGHAVGKDGRRSGMLKVDPQKVGDVYWNWIMPLTREVQVEYLLHRLD